MENKKSMVEDDEIDLYELLLIIKKRIWVIVSVVLLALVASGAYVLTAKPIYQGISLVALNNQNNQNNQNTLNPDTLAFIVDNYFSNQISNIQKEKNIVKFLSLPPQNASKITSIKAENIPQNPSAVKLIIESYDPSVIKPAINNLVEFLNNTSYVKMIVGDQKRVLEYQKNELEKSLKNQIVLSDKLTQDITNGKLSVIGFNPLELENKIIETKTQIKNIDNQLSLLGVKIIDLPPVSNTPVKPKKLLIIEVSFMSALFIGIFLAFLIEWYEKVKK